MKIIIIGSTGTIGKHLVSESLAQGHTVTAFSRNAGKLKELEHPDLRFFQGNVFDPTSVEKAIAGHDAVIVALGDGRNGKVRSEGTRNVIQAMEKTGVTRLICQSTLGAGDSAGNLNFFWKRIMFGWFLKAAYLDHQLQEEFVRKSNLDWTIVRPAAFTDGPLTKNYKHGFSAGEKRITLKISRADNAHFILEQLNSRNYLKKAPGLSY